MQQKIIQWWNTRPPREQFILRASGITLALMLCFGGVIAPLNARISTLEKRIPTLESQLTKMHVTQLPSKGKGHQSKEVSGDLRSQIFSLLSEKKVSAELRAVSSSKVEMRLPPMPAQEVMPLLSWLKDETGTRLNSVTIHSDQTPSTPRFIVELER